MKTRSKPKYAMVGGAEGSFIGPIHRMAVRMDDLASLEAGCFSRRAVSNSATGKALGLDPSRVYPDWRSLVAREKGRIDFLVVATTNETHYEIAKAALEAGIHVFCEKPISLSLSEAKRLEALADRKHLAFGVPFTYTGYPMIKLARDLVAKGELGRIDKINLEYVQGSFRRRGKRKAWKSDPKIAGPSCVVADIGVHASTMVEYVTGLRIESVLADLSSFGNPDGMDDDASILLRLSGGAKGSLVTSKIATGEENGVRLRVYGDRASLFFDQEDPNKLVVRHPSKPEAVYRRKAPCVDAISPRSVQASRFPAGHHEGFVEALANIYDEFVAAVVSGGERDYPGAEEGARSMRFVEAVLKSGRAGSRWTRL